MRRLVAGLAVVLLAIGCSDDGGNDDEPDRDEASADSTTTESTAPLHLEEELPDGRHFGQVTALDPAQNRMVFDPAELEGDVVDNPDDRMTRLTLSEDLVVRLLDPCCELSDASFEQWLDGFIPDDRSYYTTSLSYYWITIEDGEVVAVDEQFIPQ